MNEPSGYIAIGTRAVYATAFLPATTTAADMAVVLVEPLAEEKRAAYRMLVRLARALAADGLAAIRLDLSGTGDSSLPHAEATLDTWVADTCAAAEDLLAQTGARRLALVAARAGALVAAKAALRLRPERLVLAEPILSGADVLNDLERRQSIKDMMSGGNANAPSAEQRWQQGQTVDFGGYEFSATLASQLRAVSLDALLPQLQPHTVTHAIRVSPAKRLPPAWAIFGDHTAIVTDKPFWGQLDYYESDFVNDAIRQALA